MPKTEKAAGLFIADIKRLLPNRYPYLLVDRVTELIPGKCAKGYKNLTANEWYFPVHFPEEPMMPGMLQAEALLQLLSLTVLSLEGGSGKVIKVIFADKLRFRKRVVPGKRLLMEAELMQWDGNVGRGTVKGSIDGDEACSAEFEFCLEDPKTIGGKAK